MITLITIAYIIITIIFGGFLKYKDPTESDNPMLMLISAVWPISLAVYIIAYLWDKSTNYIEKKIKKILN